VGALASSSLLLAARFAIRARPGDRLVGWVMAVGAAALLGAVAYELVRKGRCRRQHRVLAVVYLSNPTTLG
jgi:hypothetical protein